MRFYSAPKVAQFTAELVAHFAAELVAQFAAELVAQFTAELVAHFVAESVAHFVWNIHSFSISDLISAIELNFWSVLNKMISCSFSFGNSFIIKLLSFL